MSVSIDGLTHEQLVQIWPHIGQELADFADYLAKNNSQGTADQLRLAILMANRHFQVASAIASTLDSSPSTGEYKSFLPQGESLASSMEQIKNLIAIIQKFYQVFTAIMTVVEPLIEPQPGPAPSPGSAPSPGPGVFAGSLKTPSQDNPA